MSNDSFGRAVTRTPNSDTITLSGRLSGVGDYLGSYVSALVSTVSRILFSISRSAFSPPTAEAVIEPATATMIASRRNWI